MFPFLWVPELSPCLSHINSWLAHQPTLNTCELSWVDVTDGQSAYPPWCWASLWGPWPDFTFPFFCRKIVGSQSYFATDWQSVSMSWYLVPLWDLQPDIISCSNVAVWNLRSCIYWVPSLTRGQICNLQCNYSVVRVAQNLKPYFTVSSETLPTWRAKFPYLYPPGTGWPSYTPRHWVPFMSSVTTRRATLEVS
jgi:hypothetical protein